MRYALFLIGAAIFAQPYNGSQVGGAPTYQTGAHGQAMRGSGTSTYITIPTGATNFAGDFVVHFKYLETTREGFQGVFEFSGATCQVFGYSGAVNCTIGGTALGTSGADVSNGSWHAVELRRVGTTGTIWVDGTQRASATVPTANLGTGTNNIGYEVATGTTLRTTSAIDEFAIFTGPSTACNPCSGSESNLRVLLHLDGNLNDSTGAPALTAGGLSQVLGLFLGAPAGGTSPYSYQLQSYTGACSSGTFTNDGAALTGQTSTALFARADGTTKCYRVVVTDAASATSNSNSVTAPASSGGGMRSY